MYNCTYSHLMNGRGRWMPITRYGNRSKRKTDWMLHFIEILLYFYFLPSFVCGVLRFKRHPTLEHTHTIRITINLCQKSYGPVCVPFFSMRLTFSMMQTKLIADPMSTCNSPEPKINASGTTTCKFTKCDIIPVAVDICNNKWYKKNESGWKRCA